MWLNFYIVLFTRDLFFIPKDNFFFSFLSTPQHLEFLGQGSDPSYSCDLHCIWSNTRSLTHCAGPGSNLSPSTAEMLQIPLCHSGNSKANVFFSTYFLPKRFDILKLRYLKSTLKIIVLEEKILWH